MKQYFAIVFIVAAGQAAFAQQRDSLKQESLHEVIIQGSGPAAKPIATATQVELKSVQLFQTRGNSLGESLKSIPGLNSIQTGPAVSKPVIHGLHSNRVLILNNGVRQEGQQWGSEHAPEIDPFTADHISIIEGAASIRYGSDAMAGVVLLEPRALPENKLLGGTVDLIGASNGRMGALSATLEGAGTHRLEGLQWRVLGTFKRAGNFRTAHYYMENTGLQEGDYAATLAYHRKQYGLSAYYSSYNTKLGVFSGSHVGNLQDLDSAFARPRPITPSYFSYRIGRSYQVVHHDLFKANGYYNFNNGGKMELVFARQKDLRQEYDVDYPYSSDPAVLNAPQISFQIITHTADLLYHTPDKGPFHTLLGLSGSTQGNVFSGLRYLVPNFRNYSGGVYAIEKYTHGKLTLEAGLRYDYRWLRVYRRDETTLYLYQNTHTYANATATGGATYQLGGRFSVNANIGTAWRAPSVNELYINGIHLSAASYERGDSTLQSERSINTTLSFKYTAPRLFVQVNLYNNQINHYIYAKPLLQSIHIISGTYPLFQYTQQDVRLRGVDAEADWDFTKHFTLVSKAAVVRGFNKSIHDWLVFMPADHFDNQLQYHFTSGNTWLQPYVSLQYAYTARQSRVPPNSDYVAPPAAYGLWNASLGSDIAIGKRTLRADLTVNNLTNVAYRDYLNRFRYYTDDLGASIVLRLSTSF